MLHKLMHNFVGPAMYDTQQLKCHFWVLQVFANYGIDFDGPLPSDEFDGTLSLNETEHVAVPQNEMSITSDTYHQLSRSINPLRDSEFYGVDIYLEVLQFVMALE